MSDDQEGSSNAPSTTEEDNLREENIQLRDEVRNCKSTQRDLTKTINSLNDELETAKSKIQSLKKNQDLAKKRNDIISKQANWGIRGFVRESLLEIMAGVDDAAACGKAREAEEGLRDFLPSVSMIGACKSAEQRTEHVEFDIGASFTEKKEIKNGKEQHAGFKLLVSSFAQFGVGASGSVESLESDSSAQTNRIRFSVPIVYGSQRDPLDEV